MVGAHHRRMHPGGDRPVVEPLTDRQQLDRVAEAPGEADVGGGNIGDALVSDVARHHPGAEGNRGDDRRLGGGVKAFDVGGRVALGVAQALGAGQRVGVAHALGIHLREDVVGRAVDDAHDAADRLADQRLAQRPDERDATGDRRLIEQVHTRRLGGVGQLATHVGQQFLVGGDHRLAGRERRRDQFASRLDAPDQLDDQVDVIVAHNPGGVGGDDLRVEGHAALPRHRSDRHAAHPQPDAGAGLDRVAVLGDQPDQRRPDVAGAQNAHGDLGRMGGGGLDCDGAHGLPRYRPGAPTSEAVWPTASQPVGGQPTSVANRSSIVSRRTTRRAWPSATKTTGGRSTLL